MMTDLVVENRDATDLIDRKKAEAFAKRMAKAVRAKANAAWDPATFGRCYQSIQEFTDCMHDFAYEYFLIEAKAKLIPKKSGFGFFSE